MFLAWFLTALLTAAAGKPQPPVQLEKVDLPTFTRELVVLQWRAADPIYAYVITPKLISKPAVVLYLYSFPSDIDRFRDDDFGKLLAKNGVAAIGFVSALTGHRYHDRPMKEWFISELPEALQSSIEDVSEIVNYLSTRNDLDVSRLGMVGEGSGGAIAIFAAARDKRIRAIDLLDPWGDWPNWLLKSTLVPEQERPALNNPEFLKRLASLEPAVALSRLTIPIRIQYLQYASNTPVEAKQRMKTCAPVQTVQPEREAAIREIRDTRGSKVLDWIQLTVREQPMR